VADTVVCIDTKPDAGDDSSRDIHRGNCGETCHIFSWCTETRFIATEKDELPYRRTA
jgi:hypothetical protein